MDLPVAMLCNAAELHDGLLYIQGGGVTRVQASSFPAALSLYLALVMEMDFLDLGTDHEVRVAVVNEDLNEIGSIQGSVGQVGPIAEAETGQMAAALPMLGIAIPTSGSYEVQVHLSGTLRACLALSVESL